ncbi:MAG: hypothetical protein PHP06_07915 [Clostridia bacterium]|nr:hypothetical protein [Clostridia bacterium]
MERNFWGRLFTFVATRIIIIGILILIIVLAGFTAYDTASAYLMLNQALETRAEVVMKDGDATMLDKYFDKRMDESIIFLNDRFEDIEVETYNYNLDTQWLFPWFGKINATVKEQVEDITIKDAGEGVSIPQWDNGQKKVKMEKINGVWKIIDIKDEAS